MRTLALASASPGMTSVVIRRAPPPSRGIITPGFCKSLALVNREGAGNAGGSSRTRRCPGSDIRMMLRRVHLRMSEPKGHQQILSSSVALDLTFATRTRSDTDANVKSATLALRAKVKKHASKSPRVRRVTRHSRTRMVLTAYGVLSPVIGLCCHRQREA